ncbi:MAG: bifunctional (p)ppGpp synthetase/guanosine-3',5'-bis(diphosphate) 3'-pyrophosphohydrolase [Synergistaceae bacterium]|jgi:GTP pyrophosphokinase|nr:bifunctional (p)ppGpp synthetase/guanosine-3',5'-bis(diphosphate) 3'-pyrophosphohydrolase [Synergistaceae bacterium]
MDEEDTPKSSGETAEAGKDPQPLKPTNVHGAVKLNMDRAMRALMESYIGRIPAQQRAASVRRSWQELWYRASRYLQKEDLMQMGDAFVYAAESHGSQLRHNDDPYIVHALGAASVLSDMQLDVQTLIAALLHDVIEDTAITPEDLGAKFGPDVLTLVDGVTKLGRLPFKNVEEYQAENLRKMFLVMAKDIRVVLIKLADRVHNMSTITGHKREKQIAIANETLEIYAPLAHRLGIYHIKRELEDMSFKVIDPEMYYDIRRRVRKKMPESENVLKKGMEILRERLGAEGVRAEILGRPKHYYSIYEKMNRKNLSLDQIYDLLALRVIVNTLAECYQVLGIVHTLWKPIPGQFDDYIANPKGNMYQSLHSTVVGPEGDPLEVQIRTWEMHRLAEYGIAAHWQYKEQKSKVTDMDIKLSWIRQALESQSESEPSDFLDHLKTDVLSTEVFVFTPQGMVISVPAGSTPIDFAYAVHTEIGHKCVGAMVNGRIVPMDYILQNGDIVRIVTSPQGKPSRDWLKIAKSNRTRNKIRSYFRQIDRAERDGYLDRGRELLEREIQRRNPGKGLSLDNFTHALNRVANDLACSSVDDLIMSVGNAHHSAQGVIARMDGYIARDEESAQMPSKLTAKIPKEVDSVVSVEGAGGVLVSLSMCCCPVPGDKIVGCVTQSRGITVHRHDCANLEKAPVERRVSVSWGKKRDARYTARIRVEANDRAGVFADLGAAISQTDGMIASIRGAVVNGTRTRFVIELQVWDLEHLYRIIARINLMSGTIETTRG